MKHFCINSLIIHDVIDAKVSGFIPFFRKTRHVTLRDVNVSDFHKNLRISLLPWYLDSVQFSSQCDHFWQSYGYMSNFAYFSYFGMFRHVDGHIFLKNDRIDPKFAQVQDFSKVNIFWEFCENPSWWRHVRSPDVMCHHKKILWNKCWRQQKWAKIGKIIIDFQNL